MKHRAFTTAVSIAFGLVLAASASIVWADQSDVRLSAGVTFSSGAFGGTDDIEDLYVPISASFDTGRVGFQLVVPYLRVSAPGEVATTTESGLGDVIGSVTLYNAYYSPDRRLALDISAAVKLGTADEAKGLGTGESDFSVYLDGYKYFDNVTLLSSVGYRWRGETADAPVDDVFLGSFGAAFSVSPEAMLGLIYDYRESALVDTDDIHELTGFVSFDLNDDWQAEVSAFAGLTDSSPDWGAGFSVSTDLRRIRARDDR